MRSNAERHLWRYRLLRLDQRRQDPRPARWIRRWALSHPANLPGSFSILSDATPPRIEVHVSSKTGGFYQLKSE